MPESEAPCRLPLTLRLDPLGQGGVETIHRQTLDVLESVGIQIVSPQLHDALEVAGARVDRDRGRVYFPGSMVEGALAQAPRSYVLAARRDGFDLELDGQHGYLSVDGCAAEVLDIATGERRPSTLADLAEASRLADALPEISLLWQPVAARDKSQQIKSLYEIHIQLANTTKHIQMMTAVTPTAARGIVEIARTVAGSSDALRRSPILSAFQCSLSPLSYDPGALEAAAVMAEAGLPCGFVAMPIAGATAPVTVTGALVQTNAEVLAGITTLQSLVPGAATFYGACTTVMDLRTGAAACGGPEDLFFQMACARLARHYEVPANIGTFATGAKSADWQAGLENGFSSFASLVAGADILGGAGLLHGASLYAPEEMVLDCEAFGLLRHLARLPDAVAAAEDSVSVLAEVGPGGHFLSHPQTLQRMRDQWMPQVFDRRDWKDWLGDPDGGPWATARDRVHSLLETNHPEPMPDDLDREIRRIIDAYEQQGENSHG